MLGPAWSGLVRLGPAWSGSVWLGGPYFEPPSPLETAPERGAKNVPKIYFFRPLSGETLFFHQKSTFRLGGVLQNDEKTTFRMGGVSKNELPDVIF